MAITVDYDGREWHEDFNWWQSELATYRLMELKEAGYHGRFEIDGDLVEIF